MSWYDLDYNIRNLPQRIRKNIKKPLSTIIERKFAEPQLPLRGSSVINRFPVMESINHVITGSNSIWDDGLRYIPPPPKREPIIEHKLTEEDLAKRSEATAEELRNKIQQYRDFIDGWMRMITELEEKITKKTALVNQSGKDKVGPFNIVGEYIDSNVPFLRDEKLTEIENLRNEWTVVERKEIELEKRIRELRRIDFKLDLKLQGKRVSFDVKEVYPLILRQ